MTNTERLKVTVSYVVDVIDPDFGGMFFVNSDSNYFSNSLREYGDVEYVLSDLEDDLGIKAISVRIIV